MYNSLLTGEEEQKSQRRFSIRTPDTQAQICHTLTLESKPEATKQKKCLRIQLPKHINPSIILFLKIASKSEGISDF